MRKFLCFLCFLMLLPWGILSAQNLKVHGVVTSDNGEVIAGANVTIKGSRTGTMTDSRGNFVLSAKKGQVLVFSYVGYYTEEIAVTGDVLNVSLIEDFLKLEEAIVTVGYGEMKKSDLTGSVASV